MQDQPPRAPVRPTALTWEAYWADSTGAPGEAFWDCAAEVSAAQHLDLLDRCGGPDLDASLPIVDLGCGNGTQTRYLAGRFPRAVGVDFAAAAIGHARGADPQSLAEYEVIDLADPGAVTRLHHRVGEANVYMRAVLHQSPAEDRPELARSIAILLGRRGRGFVIELRPEAKDHLQNLARDPAGPHPKLRKVFDHGLRPGEAGEAEIQQVMAGAALDILGEGSGELVMTVNAAGGQPLRLPAQWFVVAASQRAGGSS